jgi:hypothetical protein
VAAKLKEEYGEGLYEGKIYDLRVNDSFNISRRTSPLPSHSPLKIW